MDPSVLDHVRRLDRFPAYVYDLPGLRAHAATIKAALGTDGPEIFYAAKANPDAPILRALAPYVDGIELSSGGELAHVRKTLPEARLAFGGPGKTDDELALALDLGVERIHVESPYELERLTRIATGRGADILLRANLPIDLPGAALTMSGPFGMDEDALTACAGMLAEAPDIRLRGIHAHLASGLAAPVLTDLAKQITAWALPWLATHAPSHSPHPPPGNSRSAASPLADPEVNLGGGMAVDYRDPQSRFDWAAYTTGLSGLGGRLRIEPGRAMTAYHGWYVTDVLDVKTTRGEVYVILRGGTHHLRTPVTKGHNQPFTVISRGPESGPSGPSAVATLVGQLCTPKDVFARAVPVPQLRPGDLVAFGMAGAYAWNISHHDFCLHPQPDHHYIDR